MTTEQKYNAAKAILYSSKVRCITTDEGFDIVHGWRQALLAQLEWLWEMHKMYEECYERPDPVYTPQISALHDGLLPKNDSNV